MGLEGTRLHLGRRVTWIPARDILVYQGRPAFNGTNGL